MSQTAWMTNAATLLCGDTGTGKTTLIATYAEWVWAKFGKVTRYCSFDAGGFGDTVVALVNAGIIEVWRPRTRDPDGNLGLPTGTCALATQGHWPKHLNLATGDCPPAVELVGPSTIWYTMLCPKGHKVKKVMSQNLLTPAPCPECKVLTNKGNAGITKEVAYNPGFENVGAWAFDGLTSMSDWCKADVNARAAKDELGGLKGNINTVRSSGLAFGTSGMGGVGFVQDRAQDWVYNSINIRGRVAPPLFTSLELRATDDNDLPIYGPKLIGKAKTSDVPSWVGNCLGTAIVTDPDTQKEKHRLYLQEYRTPGDPIPHLCKNRAAALLPEYLEDPPDASLESGTLFSVFNLGVFFDLLDGALKKAEARVKAKYPNAPGLRKSSTGEQKEEVQIQEEAVEVPAETAAGATAPTPTTAKPTAPSSPTPAKNIPPAAPRRIGNAVVMPRRPAVPVRAPEVSAKSQGQGEGNPGTTAPAPSPVPATEPPPGPPPRPASPAPVKVGKKK